MNTDITFVSELPPPSARARGAAQDVIKALQSRPNEWAEIARYPKAKRGNAYSRGFQFVARHPDFEYTVRPVGDEVVLFMRAVTR